MRAARHERGCPVQNPSSIVDELVRAAREHEAEFPGHRAVTPAKHLTIVTCMDSRLDIFRIFGLDIGDAHILRNAGGLATDDMLRSLVVSQRLLNTRAIILMQHTDCGLNQLKEQEFRAELARETGSEPPYDFGAFVDVDRSVRQALERVRTHRFLPARDCVRGFVYDVDTGALREVE
jgi:carbonic anhydrase